MLIRNAKRSDLRHIAEIYDNAYDEIKYNQDFGDYLRLKRPKMDNIQKWERNVYNDILNKNAIFLVALENEQVVGFCFVRKKDIPDSEISHVGILGIRIIKEFRKKGLGTKLVSRILKESKGKFEIIEVEVMAVNKTSKALFNKFNFKKWGTAPRYVKRGKKYIDLEYMYLKL